MKPSVYNYATELGDGRRLLLNTFSGAADLVPREALSLLEAAGGAVDGELAALLSARRYLLEDDVDEQALARGVYEGLLQHRRQQTRLHAVLLLTFRCNLKCEYCWQQTGLPQAAQAGPASMDTRTVDLALKAVGELREKIPCDRGAEPLVHLFGGEPLLPANRPVVEHVLHESAARCWPAQITTNGTYLDYYEDLLSCSTVKEIQVTIDGPGEVHNRRRLGSDYRKLMDALDRIILRCGILVKLRVNVDLTNLSSLPELADDIYARQWYATRAFFGYVAPLRDAGPDRRLLRQRPQLLDALRDLVERQPKLEIFDFLGWDGYEPVRAFAAMGRMPLPRVHICDVNLNQFVFGPGGDVHVCLEDAANPCSRVGRFVPELALEEAAFRRWYDRGPFDLEHCRNCNLLPVCGGGCQLWQGDPQQVEAYCSSVKECFRASLVRAFDNGELP